MKKTVFAVAVFMLLTLIGTNVKAAYEMSAPTTTNATTNAEERNAIIARVYEIKNMDKSNLSLSQKKALRQELHSLRKRYREYGGVYISVGSLIIIILLLILILR